MNAPREDLAAVLANWFTTDPGRWVYEMYEGAADAIIAAGWTPPPRPFPHPEHEFCHPVLGCIEGDE